MWGSGKCPLMTAPARATNTITHKMSVVMASEDTDKARARARRASLMNYTPLTKLNKTRRMVSGSPAWAQCGKNVFYGGVANR